MRYVPLTIALVAAACGGTDPSEPSARPGQYTLSYAWLEPGPFGRVIERTETSVIVLELVTADSVAGYRVRDGDPAANRLGAGFWNNTAYLVYIPRGSSRAQVRVNRDWTSCTGSIFYAFGNTPDFIRCSVRRDGA